MEIEGLDKLLQQLSQIKEDMPQIVGDSMVNVIDGVMKDSAPQVPFKTGHLRRTMFVNGPDVSDGRILVSFGYSAEYAKPVHDIPPPELWSAGRTAYHRPPTKYRFMADPLEAAAPGFPDALIRDIDEQLEALLG